jgi:hypothetical protein
MTNARIINGRKGTMLTLHNPPDDPLTAGLTAVKP